MATDIHQRLVRRLSELPLLDAVQQQALTQQLQQQFPSAKALLEELVRRGWLTLFQAQHCAQGREAELVLGPYIVLDKLGEGGNGQVFKARHRIMQRIVALKVVRRELLADTETVQRFYREIEVISQLSHPHIVHAYDAGPIGTTLVLALEYVEGVDLDRLVKEQGPLPVGVACDYVRQAALGLQHAHERGLIHRDIKPANLLLSVSRDPKGSAGAAGTSLSLQRRALPFGWWLNGVVKILDLGLARLREPSAASKTRNLTVLAGNAYSVGTPDYQAPEQALDFHSADIRADVYSLGCTFYYLLTGRPPFEGVLVEKLIKHQQAEPPRAPLAHLPPDLQAIIRKMLAKRPVDRYQMPAEVAAVLAPFCIPVEPASPTSDSTLHSTRQVRLTGLASHRRRWRLLLLGSLALVGLCGGGLVLFRSGPDDTSRSSSRMASETVAKVPTVNFGQGFTAAGLTFNGNAGIQGNRLRLTDSVNNQRGSAYYHRPVNVDSFASTFTFQMTKPQADGIAFVLQNEGPQALGGAGGGLGYLGIRSSLAVKFDIYGGNGEDNSTGLYVQGAMPNTPFRPLPGMTLKSGHVFRVALTYDGKTLATTITDADTGAKHSEHYTIDIPATVGQRQAFVGFTGATGGLTARQEILTWTFE